MRKRSLAVAFEILQCYAEEFRQVFKEITGYPFPEDYELTTSDFEKNDTYQQLRHVISEKLRHKSFHPKKLYTYVFEHLRMKNKKEFERYQKHPDGAIWWKITSDFPKMLFQLLNYDGLQDFLQKKEEEVSAHIVKKQGKYIQAYHVQKDQSTRQITGLFHCYVSDLEGFKIGKLAMYSNQEVELILNDPFSSHYRGFIRENTHWLTMDFVKEKKGLTDKSLKKNGLASEVSFKFLAREDFDQHIFIFGTYSAINRNDYVIKNPARVAGPVILEWLDPELYNSTTLPNLSFIEPQQVDPIIAAKVTGRRIEEKRTYSRKSVASTFSERRKEELHYINKNNQYIQNPKDHIGTFLCLVYSQTHHVLRKLIFKVNSDLTVTSEAAKYHNEKSKITYKGMVTSFANGLFSFRVSKDVRHDYIEGVFLCKSVKKTMYGLLHGVFKDMPKSGRAILIPVSEELSQIVDTEEPGFINIGSTVYNALDEKHAITEFYAGKEMKEEKFNSNIIINDSMEVFEQLLCQKRGDFESIQGMYEEYYYDHDLESLRKDYLMIKPDGNAYMIGTYCYEGYAKRLRSKFLLDFRSKNPNQSPVFYLLHQESNYLNIFSGIFASISENNREIVGNAAYLRKVSDEIMDLDAFYLDYGNKTEIIALNTERFREINAELDNLGHMLAGQVGNSIAVDNFQKLRSTNINSRKMAYTFFYAACFLASLEQTKYQFKAIHELDRAFKHGFSDRILLEGEMKEGKSLFSIKEFIDKENFKIDGTSLRDVG